MPRSASLPPEADAKPDDPREVKLVLFCRQVRTSVRVCEVKW
jgi:hypothetical protein